MNEKTVGENIRAIRLASRASLTEVAKRAKSTLSKIENGQTSSPISTLVPIAAALGVHLGDFFREKKASTRYILTRKEKGKVIVRDGSRFGYAYEALAIDFLNKPVEPFLLTISPGDKVGSFRHKGHEFFYMISGKIEFTHGEEKMVMQSGDSLYIDSTITHRTRLLSKTPARFLCLFIETP
jgi:transcriptional regulator with XRE-family HTH domain